MKMVNLMMRNRRLVGCLFLSILVTGCGKSDNNPIQDIARPQLEVPNSPELELDITKKAQSGIEIRNGGDADLTIKDIRITNAPAQFRFKGTASNNCSGNDDTTCTNGETCISSQCYTLQPPAFPETLKSKRSYFAHFVVTGNVSDLECEKPGADVPEQYKQRYCGEIVIQTNASNSNEASSIHEGTSRIYLQYTPRGSSGELSNSVLTFDGVVADSTQSKKVTLTNTGKTPLEVTELAFDGDSDVIDKFEASPKAPFTLQANESKEIQVTLKTKEGENQLKFNASLLIATNGPTLKLELRVTYEEAEHPILSYDKTMLSFKDSNEQTFTISNTGTSTLIITSITLSGKKIQGVYSFTINGKNINRYPIGKGKTAEVKVKLKESVPHPDKKVGYLTINHNDSTFAQSADVILLGTNEPGPYGRLYPQNLFFSENASTQNNGPDELDATRTFVVQNLGTEALKLTGVQYDNQNESTFTVEPQIDAGAPTTIAAGEFKTFVLQKDNKNQSGKKATMQLTTDSDLSSIDGFSDDKNRLAREINVNFTDNSDKLTLKAVPVVDSNSKPNFIKSFKVETNAENDSYCIWLLTKRPANSKIFVSKTLECKEGLTIRPDVPGDYQLSTIIPSQSAIDASVDFTVD